MSAGWSAHTATKRHVEQPFQLSAHLQGSTRDAWNLLANNKQIHMFIQVQRQTM